MKKLILLIIPILLLCGCKNIKDINVDEEYNYEAQYADIMTYCDKKYGVEYIIFVEGNRAGISVRLDENENVIHCK